MKPGWSLLLWISLWSVRLLGTEPLPVRSVIVIEQGNIRITAPDTAASQTLGVWVRQSIATLETLWQTDIPFQQDVPMEIRVEEDATEVALLEQWREGVLYQRIQIPQAPEHQDPVAMADALARALSHRSLLAATSGRWVEAPDWWVRGHGLILLKGGGTAALQEAMSSMNGEIVSPVHWIQDPAATPVSLQVRARELLLCRWVRHWKKGEAGWTWLAGWDPEFATKHLKELTGVTTPRAVNVHWAVWMAADRDALLSEYRLEKEVLQELEQRTRLHPALLGVHGLPERYRPMDLDQLVTSLDLDGMEELLTTWNVRLQPLAFRQSEDLHLVIKHYLDAGLALGRASETSGRNREQHLKQFRASFLQARKAHHAMLLGMRPEGSAAEDGP